jgi:purine-binding chemotaxis protein CheW
MSKDNGQTDLNGAAAASGENRDYVTMSIGGQLFGIPVLKVQDVLGSQTITRVPLAPVEVAGEREERHVGGSRA